jgi:hypothetical protein
MCSLFILISVFATTLTKVEEHRTRLVSVEDHVDPAQKERQLIERIVDSILLPNRGLFLQENYPFIDEFLIGLIGDFKLKNDDANFKGVLFDSDL